MTKRTPEQLTKHRNYMKEWNKCNPDKVKQHSKNKYAAMKADPLRAARQKEYIKNWQHAYRINNPDKIKSYQRARYQANLEKRRTYARNWNWKLKLETIAAYGGHCVCCGEDTPEFLSIDHINNDGNLERKRGADGIRRPICGHKSYVRLRQQGWPSHVQLLCFNCNCAKGFFGECPHKNNSLLMVRGA